jgi:hypothetical protein
MVRSHDLEIVQCGKDNSIKRGPVLKAIERPLLPINTRPKEEVIKNTKCVLNV